MEKNTLFFVIIDLFTRFFNGELKCFLPKDFALMGSLSRKIANYGKFSTDVSPETQKACRNEALVFPTHMRHRLFFLDFKKGVTPVLDEAMNAVSVRGEGSGFGHYIDFEDGKLTLYRLLMENGKVSFLKMVVEGESVASVNIRDLAYRLTREIAGSGRKTASWMKELNAELQKELTTVFRILAYLERTLEVKDSDISAAEANTDYWEVPTKTTLKGLGDIKLPKPIVTRLVSEGFLIGKAATPWKKPIKPRKRKTPVLHFRSGHWRKYATYKKWIEGFWVPTVRTPDGERVPTELVARLAAAEIFHV